MSVFCLAKSFAILSLGIHLDEGQDRFRSIGVGDEAECTVLSYAMPRLCVGDFYHVP